MLGKKSLVIKVSKMVKIMLDIHLQTLLFNLDATMKFATTSAMCQHNLLHFATFYSLHI